MDQEVYPAGITVFDYYRFKAAPNVIVTVEVTPTEDSTPAQVKQLAHAELAKARLQVSLLEDLPDDLPTNEEV